jgi:hypothetical protein
MSIDGFDESVASLPNTTLRLCELQFVKTQINGPDALPGTIPKKHLL